MLKKRIIPCLDVKNGRVVKGIEFQNHIDMGDPAQLGEKYYFAGADELVFYDITASVENRHADLKWISKVAKVLAIPFTVAGGIRSLDDAKKILNAGADKISINTPALENPDLIDIFAKALGSQCVVIGIDIKDGLIYKNTGSPLLTEECPQKSSRWFKEIAERGAGEIVINSMNNDGVRNGYNIKLINQVCDQVNIPVIASGGAGCSAHFLELFQKTNASGALAAGIFHSEQLQIPALKNYLKNNKIAVRI